MRSFIFNVLIALDHLLNVLLLGRIGTCLSTRAYIQAQLLSDQTEKWTRWQKRIDKLMREENHCLKSFAWELNRNRNWVNEHNHLLGLPYIF